MNISITATARRGKRTVFTAWKDGRRIVCGFDRDEVQREAIREAAKLELSKLWGGRPCD